MRPGSNSDILGGASLSSDVRSMPSAAPRNNATKKEEQLRQKQLELEQNVSVPAIVEFWLDCPPGKDGPYGAQTAGAISRCDLSCDEPGEPIFKDDADRHRWVETLGECCAKTDWQVHA